MIQMTYRNKEGEIIRRTISTGSPYKIGDTNSFGWTVTDIKYKYGDKYYHREEYDHLVNRSISRMRSRMKIRNKISKLYTNMIYLIELMIAVKVLEFASRQFI